MRAVGRVVGLLAALVAVLALSAAAGAAPSDGLIVFPALPQSGQPAQLYSISPSGLGLKQLTTGSNPALEPAISPGGKRIAFERFGVGLFTMNVDGTGLRRLTKNGRDAYPTWSPNGAKIAFVRPVGPAWRLFVMPASGGKAKRLPQSPAAGRPTWTKAGLLVPTSGDLLRVDPRTGKVLKYFNANIDAIWGLNSVAISPTGSQLAYVGSREPESGDMECGDGPCQRFGLFLESLTAKKKTPRLIVKDTGAAAFSPDGKRLVFVTGNALVLRPVGSTARTTIPTGDVIPAETGPPAWR
jgi:Tol biopolymer transport system component